MLVIIQDITNSKQYKRVIFKRKDTWIAPVNKKNKFAYFEKNSSRNRGKKVSELYFPIDEEQKKVNKTFDHGQ